MKAQQLKNSILQLAVQGKLVPQDPNDEPASVLLERIRAEKQRLIKEGKIKKNKNESVIYRAPKAVGGDSADNLPYTFLERTADGVVRDITDELPFEIPDSWEWVRIGTVFNLQAGKFVQAKDIHDDSDGRFPCYGGNGLRGYVDSYNREGTYPLIGRQGALCGNINFATGQFYATEHAVVVEYFCDVDVYWIGYFLTALNLNQYSTATAQPGLAVANINTVLLPLPPFAEQRRLVECIGELLPHISDYDSAEQRLTALNTTFPDQLKKSILQAAVQGKLVPQDPADEPADILLERIQAEKEALIEAGKIKRGKHESVIFRRDNTHYEKQGGIECCIDDEIPFDVPENWAWVRLGTLCDYGECENVESCDIAPKAWLLDLEDIEKDSGRLLQRKRKHEVKSLSTKHRFTVGQVLYSKLRPYLNKVIIADEDGYCTSEILPLDFGMAVYDRYAQIYLMSPLFVAYATQCSYGVKMPRLGTQDGRSALVPLPPFAEQERIISRVDALLLIHDRLI
jgi:type I restriction enzyme S subunit